MGDPQGAEKDSHASGLLEHPHYTRPAEFRGWQVPEILRSGNHALVEEWRRLEAIRRTALRRPELLEDLELSKKEKEYLQELQEEEDEEGAE